MKHLLILIVVLKTSISFGRNPQRPDSIPQPVYDTTSIDIQSTNSFYFCSKLYAIPRDCDNKDQSNCCSFSSQITKGNKGIINGQISCYNGTSLFWTAYDSEETVKQNFEGYPGQIKKQMKKFKQEEIAFFLCDKKVSALMLTYTTLQGYDFTELIFWDTINGQSIFGKLSLPKTVKSSKSLTPFFQQLVRF